MRYFDRVFSTPEEELACDEVLLDVCEEEPEGEVLRVWQPQRRYVVLGYTNAAAREVDLPACAAAGIPVYRRTTGGGTIVQMPGCLNYSLVLRMEGNNALEGIDSTNRYVLERVGMALTPLARAPVVRRGHTDLCIGTRKVAGNAQRRKSRALLFHGTLLLHAEIEGIGRLLPLPSTQPDYRNGRTHTDFLTTLGIEPAAVTAALQAAWQAITPYDLLIEDQVAVLAREQYRNREWIFRR